MIETIFLEIKKPDDTGDYYSPVEIKSESLRFRANDRVCRVGYDRGAKDPIHSSLCVWWKKTISHKHFHYHPHFRMNAGVPILLYIGELPLALSRVKGRFKLNGKTESMSTIANAFARVTVTAMREKNPVKLMASLMKVMSLSENVKYCLENRAPFHYFVDFEKIDVRLNVQQISDKECAIEISDGLWASISNKDLDSFCTFFLHGKRTGKFKFMGIKKLFTYLMGKAPTKGELHLMREFLKQNRQQDIVEDRALELLNEMVNQHPDKLELTMEGNIPSILYIKGAGYDWKLENSEFKSDIQMVSTYVYQPKPQFNEEGNSLPFEECDWAWKGPICIDNMAKGSSLGDQFATRALALINDTHTIQIVSTIKRYLIAPENTNRIENYEMFRVQDE